MGKITARNSTQIAAPPQRVVDLLADYHQRPQLQPSNFSAFRILSGGVGDETIAAWHLQATKKRSRDVEVTAAVHGSPDSEWTLTETDAHSSMVTTYTVTPVDSGTAVEVVTTWKGAGGVGGFFERIFAPAGLQRIHGAQLDRLAELASEGSVD